MAVVTDDGTQSTTPTVGTISSAFNEDDWSYDVFVPLQNGNFDFTLAEITLNNVADTSITTSRDCYSYAGGWVI